MMGKQEGVWQEVFFSRLIQIQADWPSFEEKNISTFTFLEFPGKHTLVVEQQELAGGLFDSAECCWCTEAPPSRSIWGKQPLVATRRTRPALLWGRGGFTESSFMQ